VSKLRKNMKNKVISMFDKLMLRKRAVIESVFDPLKNMSQIEHSRHRSVHNFLVNLIAELVVYSLKPKKTSLNLEMLAQMPGPALI